MATVPVATQQVQPQLRQPVYQSIPGANNIASFGGDTTGLDKAAAGLESAGKEIADAVVKQQIEDNTRISRIADNDLQAAHHALMFGDGTADNPGYLSAKGENAISKAEETKAALKKAAGDISTTLPGPRTQNLFGDMARVRVEQELKTVDVHVQQQRIVAEDTASDARKMGAVNDAAAHAGDPVVLSRSLSIVNGEIADEGRRKGFAGNKDVMDAKLAEARSLVVGESVKASLAQENVEQAVKTFNDNAGVLDAKTRVALTAALQQQTVTKQGQTIADKLFAKHGGDVQAALAELQQIATGKSRDAAWEHYNSILQSIHSGVRFNQEQADRNNPEGGTLAQRAYMWGKEHLRDLNIEQDRARAAQTQERATLNDAAMNRYLPDIYSGDLSKMPTVQEVMNNPDLTPASKENLKAQIAAASREEPPAKVSAKTATELYARIHAPADDPNRITDEVAIHTARAAGKLTSSDADWLQKQVKDARTDDGQRVSVEKDRLIKRVQSSITATIIGKQLDQTGDIQLYNYERFVDSQIATAIKDGKDWTALLGTGPGQLASPEVIARYQTPLDERMKKINDGLRPAAKDYTSKEELQKAQAAGLIGYEAAVKMARDKGWIK